MFESAQFGNKLLNGVLRVVFFLVVAIGLLLVLRRRVIGTTAAPESIWFDLRIALFAVVLALPVVLLVIGARWVVYEPPFGGGLLAGGLMMLGLLIWLTRRSQSGISAGLFGGSGKKWTDESAIASAASPSIPTTPSCA